MANYTSLSIKKTTIFSILISFFITFSYSQDNPDNQQSFWKNVQFGGGIGLNFGDGFFSGALSPNAVYRFNPYVATGIGLNFSYSSQKDVFKSTVIGGSVLGLFNPYRELQISTEFEQLHVSRNFDEEFIANADDEYWYPALFLGLGYTNGNVTFGIRYDVLYDKDKSIYNEAWMPFVRFWF
ncbi:alpha-ketoglutarate decarboxylase [Winogradskyella echinorum]|uniref:Alpha-ketoglutarate decarboxylase n=1 Tax=Winogradskyella echinorum TaxID=538189 RepID=A0ABR6Y097_9FLAO|nr:alpha-ketoglutarate decarboxylase [Winogradskyella echinorum]MBC3846059.1 alpha-ketoglutarate decarboxylase [Winogradskyella echinorum]MBC5750407.1 alpha-ketoglutarate decarboxylase [Winogradskyella echinorum]